MNPNLETLFKRNSFVDKGLMDEKDYGGKIPITTQAYHTVSSAPPHPSFESLMDTVVISIAENAIQVLSIKTKAFFPVGFCFAWQNM